MWRELHHRGVKPYPECVTNGTWCFCKYVCCASDFDDRRYHAAMAEYMEANTEMDAQRSGEEIVVQVEDVVGNVSTVTLLNSLHVTYILQQLPFVGLSGTASSEVELTFAEMPLHLGSAGAKDSLKEHGVETGATLRLRGAELAPGPVSVPVPMPAGGPDITDYQLPRGAGVCCSALLACVQR